MTALEIPSQSGAGSDPTEAIRPAAWLEALLIDWRVIQAGGRLEARIRAGLFLLLAQRAGDAPSQRAARDEAREAGMSKAEIAEAAEGRSADPREDALLALALTLLENRGGLLDEDVEPAYRVGLPAEALLDLAAELALCWLRLALRGLERAVAQ